MSFEQQMVGLQDVERYRAEAKAMQSRETARLVRRLFGAPARLMRRVGHGNARRGTAAGTETRHA